MEGGLLLESLLVRVNPLISFKAQRREKKTKRRFPPNSIDKAMKENL